MSIQIDAGGGAGGTRAFPVEIFTGTAKNLVVADNLKFFAMTNVATITVTIPENSSEPFPIGATMEFLRDDSGVVIFVAAGSVILDSRDDLVTINSEHSEVSLKKIAIDKWVLAGDLA